MSDDLRDPPVLSLMRFDILPTDYRTHFPNGIVFLTDTYLGLRINFRTKAVHEMLPYQ